MSKLYKYLAISLLTTVAGFFAGMFVIPAAVAGLVNLILIVYLIAKLIGAWKLRREKKKNRGLVSFPIWVVYILAFFDGAMLYPVLMYYLASLGVVLFAEIVIGTMVIFGVLAYMGHKKESASYGRLSSILLVILIVMIFMTIVNLILRLDILSILLSAGGIALFSTYIFIDIYRFKKDYEMGVIQDSSDYSIYVLNVYLDIMNLLLDLLDLADWFTN
jgi:FtsH-binding integral membrane protein